MGLAGICLLLLGIGVVFEAVSNYFGVQKYPAPGKLVNIGGYNLHLNKHGEGKPVIILETGSGASSTIWRDMPEKLAAYGTVVTYDRGGYGWSEKAATERSGENIVNELYTALKNEGLEGPYILVGHSLGGMYSRLFAQTFPNEVAGLILLDTRPEDFSNETELIFHEAGIKNAVLEGTPSAPFLVY